MCTNRYCPPSLLIYLSAVLLFNLISPFQMTHANTTLHVTDKLSSADKELTVETGEWKVIFSLFYNGGIYRMFDKVYDPAMQDNLLTGPWYCQGGIFDYDIYLLGYQECMTTMGRNNNTGHATLEILENTPVRLRLRQKCHPRLNNGEIGPPDDQFVELKMIDTTTDWTFYPTGRVNIKLDVVVAPDWNEIFFEGPGGTGKGIDANGITITAVNGTSFYKPWVTQGDSIESPSAGWGPVQVAQNIGGTTLRLASPVPSGKNLDFRVRRNNIIEETFSIHADGDPNAKPRTSFWQGGSNGDPLYDNGTDGDMFRNRTPPVQRDYVFAHWTRPPRQFGSLLALSEPYRQATNAIFNDLSYDNISYTQVSRHDWRPFEEHHRHFMAQLGTENGRLLPRIKSVADALPFADDYRHPYAEARAGKLQTGDGISVCGFHLPTGAYHISADANNIAAIAFDANRGGSVSSPIAYYQPAILVSDFNVPDDRLVVQLSRDNGETFQDLPKECYNITTREEAKRLGARDRRLMQLLKIIPSSAAGADAWVIRFCPGKT